MILIIGSKNCIKCRIAKESLNKQNIKYDYKNLEDITTDEQNTYMEIARINKQLSMPLIFKNDEITTLEEVLNVTK